MQRKNQGSSSSAGGSITSSKDGTGNEGAGGVGGVTGVGGTNSGSLSSLTSNGQISTPYIWAGRLTVALSLINLF